MNNNRIGKKLRWGYFICLFRQVSSGKSTVVFSRQRTTTNDTQSITLYQLNNTKQASKTLSNRIAWKKIYWYFVHPSSLGSPSPMLHLTHSIISSHFNNLSPSFVRSHKSRCRTFLKDVEYYAEGMHEIRIFIKNCMNSVLLVQFKPGF